MVAALAVFGLAAGAAGPCTAKVHGKTTAKSRAAKVPCIYLNKPQLAIDDVPPGYFGHSVGHWDGDTLVVDTVGIKESVRGMRDLPHTDQMRISERLHLITPDILQDQITITDPK